MDANYKVMIIVAIVLLMCCMSSSAAAITGSQTNWFGLVNTEQHTTTSGAGGTTTGATTGGTTTGGTTGGTTVGTSDTTTVTTSAAVINTASPIITTAAPVTPAAIPWVSHPNFDSAGNDLRFINTGSADDCARACSADSNCKWFITNGNGQSCWLKSGYNQTTYAMPDRTIYFPPGTAWNPICTVWADANFSGTSVWFYPGEYGWLPVWNFPNDSMSSIKVPPGFKATLFDGKDFTGRSIDLVAGEYPNLKQQNFNDICSSMKYYGA